MRTAHLLSIVCVPVVVFASACMMPQGNYGSSTPSASNAPAAAPGGEEGSAGGSSGGSSAAPSGPQIDSVSLHNDCPQQVKLFLGEKPKWGSGTSTSIGVNTTQSYTLNPGDKIWIVDGNDEGVSSYAGQPGMHSVKITSSCNQFAPN